MTQSPRDSASQAKPADRSGLLDVVTVVFVILTVTLLAWIVLVINDPATALNPLPPPTVASVVQPPSLTPSPTVTDTPTVTATFTPSNTPTVTATPTATNTPTATATSTATMTQVFSGLPTDLPTLDQPSPIPPLDDGSGGTVPGSGTADNGSSVVSPRTTVTRSPFPFTAAPVRYEANTGDQGCQWLSIAGTVMDLNRRSLPDLAIEINGDNFHSVQFSGSAARWGTAGYEFNLGAAPRAATYTLRLLGPTGGPISEVIYVETGNTCQRNIAIVDFIQNHPY